MKALFINPDFATPKNAIGYHTKLLFDAISDCINSPIIVGKNGCDDYKNPHTFLPVKPIPLRYVNALINRSVPDIILQPDEDYWAIKHRFVKAILKNVDFSQIDYIHSFSNPQTAHVIAYEIHKITQKPWIAQLYDPWTDSPYRKYSYSFFRKKDQELESLVANNAAAIIHTNHIINKKWADRYGEKVIKKSFVLPLTYSNERFQQGKNIPLTRKKDKLIISHIGKLFCDRDLRDVIKALSLLKQEDDSCPQKIVIRVVGQITPHDIKMMKELRCEEFFEIIPYQNKEKLIDYYIESDAFLLIESQQKENVFFPSKLLDYFLYQRPIIGITPQIGETTELLNKSGNIAICNGDIMKLKTVFSNFIDGNYPLFVKDFYKNYSPEVLSKQYKDILSFILNR
jgi:glycosyltransferase involved in cell wall biosynthesis